MRLFQQPEQVLETLRSGFGAARVLVVGDLMLDRYLWGDVRRISPEAPVPVLRLARESAVAGGAANVARNLVGLGLQVHLAGITGADPQREQLLGLLREQGIDTSSVLVDASRPTTTKTRVIGNHQQMLRIDAEHSAPVAAAIEAALMADIEVLLAQVDVLLLSDYAKGVLTADLCQRLIVAAGRHDVPVLIDPKGRAFERYSGATLMTPNRAELAAAAAVDADDLAAVLEAARAMRAQLNLQHLLLTLGEQGIALVDADDIRRIPAMAREVFDVSGAGDTVIATVAAGCAAGLDMTDTAHLANLAAGVVVGKVGTAAIGLDELTAALADEAALEQAAKVGSLQQVLAQVQQWRGRGERIVFTNGCFDLLHVGHVTYLERARRHGQRLVVGLNTDRSVRALKGEGRPLIEETDRARVLAALAAVDAVVLFDEDTPIELIRRIQPDVLVKGADYREADVVGAAEVKARGGEVVLVPLVADRSTSGIAERIQSGGVQRPVDSAVDSGVEPK
ncbi:D-glycero-beta-D-manno-heptose-7-phosphate kinase [Thiohalocapsa marina]|uniref:Bifunctional protein HldE n=1 Tax=Thiohalocapsa marina TaxID=424902 RepID=A0A5M8FPP9_9GAMM|nr:D-glycero-beta-D-manno-heptose-7-phosphate kinase [Thiohalocapsa marina]KAA6185091.1 D-glycero-beta-D-manno-heptose-7-phosphate kinase [Thiohalocapsa marina]